MRASEPPTPSRLSRSAIPIPATALVEPVAPVTAGSQPRWLEWQVLIPLVLLAVATICLIPLGGDRWLADRIYAAEGGYWALRDNFLTAHVLHSGGKALSMLAWCATVVMALWSMLRPNRTAWRRPLFALLLSVVVSTLLVSVLKHTTGMDCPWDATIYGGTHPYFTLFQGHPPGIKPSGCFPAGQASAGYAWVALYFYFLRVHPRWRHMGLAFGIVFGAALGVAQQLRGAHYLSHDVWTLAVCWFVALAIHRLGVRRAQRHAAGFVPGAGGHP